MEEQGVGNSGEAALIKEMSKGELRDIYKEAVDKFGVESQIWMAIEEMGELITALSHFWRGRITADEVTEEVADVMLMIEQMAYIFGREVVTKKLADKKERLASRLDYL
jgi:NTP pyrophosphatase (non-canonical NTP hydrolase)